MTLSLLAGLFRAQEIQCALLIVPVSVLCMWKNEAKRLIAPLVDGIVIEIVSSSESLNTRQRILNQAIYSTRSSIVVTSYEFVRLNTTGFLRNDHTGLGWDYVVLDEGHKIKNPKAETTLACHRISNFTNTRRLLLTGTPLMNNLNELWTLFDWVTSGKVLGSPMRFKNDFAKLIEIAREKHATLDTIRNGECAKQKLQIILKPFFLQRLKIDYLHNQLPTKTEFVIWTHISDEQRTMYESFLKDSKVVDSIMAGKKMSPLEAVTYLKKLCGHPVIAEQSNDRDFSQRLQRQEINSLLRRSSKLEILLDIVQRVCLFDHRVLVFSQSTRTLDILQKTLSGNNIEFDRIDGSTNTKRRQLIVEDFNSNTRIKVMLLSTAAAGVGLTLVGADRVIVYDPAWTPALDAQAVDRCYRIGQTRPVVVYRLIAAGTVEEKMYEKQVYKEGIRRTVFSENFSVERHFNKDELRQLFILAPKGVCQVLSNIQGQPSNLKVVSACETNEDADEIKYIQSHRSVVGVALHDDVFKHTKIVNEDENVVEGKEAKVVGRAQRIMAKSRLQASPSIKTARDKPRGDRAVDPIDITRNDLKGKENLTLLQNQVASFDDPQKGLDLCLDFLDGSSFEKYSAEDQASVHQLIGSILVREGMRHHLNEI
jgi:SNF2 family DNA or RNA helicase